MVHELFLKGRGNLFPMISILTQCYSPDHLVFRMGSFVSQFSPSAEIWRNEVGHYAHFFWIMYGKIGLKIENFYINGRKSENLPVHLLWNLVDMFILWSYKKYMRELWKFWFFGRLHRTECWKIMKNQKFEHSVRCNRPKNPNFHNSRIYFL